MRFEFHYSKEEVGHTSLFMQHMTFTCLSSLITAICKTFWCSDHFNPSAVLPSFLSCSSESFWGSGLSYAWSSSPGLVKADIEIKDDSQAVSKHK